MIALHVMDFDFAGNNNRITGFQGIINVFVEPFIRNRKLRRGVHLTLVVVLHFKPLHDEPKFFTIEPGDEEKAGRKFGDGCKRAGMQSSDMVEIFVPIGNESFDVVVSNFNYLKSMWPVERNHTV